MPNLIAHFDPSLRPSLGRSRLRQLSQKHAVFPHSWPDIGWACIFRIPNHQIESDSFSTRLAPQQSTLEATLRVFLPRSSFQTPFRGGHTQTKPKPIHRPSPISLSLSEQALSCSDHIQPFALSTGGTSDSSPTSWSNRSDAPVFMPSHPSVAVSIAPVPFASSLRACHSGRAFLWRFQLFVLLFLSRGRLSLLVQVNDQS
ncbi:hypothetical protein BLNAU_14402 [Blattamonas nauphoetae]|uniref:Uncharacterized protein n=1 Tax=Blattamonas nauphoetae TaxID=2049346 RepID=A0ABQ9XFK9_9EUKA|nr:hypothetical protein BLNAU_14402 [Blattamonas nauphoetae]